MTSLGRSVGGSVFRAKPSWSVMVFMCAVAYRRVVPRSSPSRIAESIHASLGWRLSLSTGSDHIAGGLQFRHDDLVAEGFIDSERPTIGGRTWFAIDGTLDPISFEGPSFFRFPDELARLVIERFTSVGDLVLDPFSGFGTTLVAAQALGRTAIGIEKDAERFRFAASRVHEPSRVIHASSADLGTLDLPRADLVFTSPPYTSFRDWDEKGFAAYWDDFESIFSGLRAVLHPAGRLVVELSNVRDTDGGIRTVAFEAALRLREWYEFLGEVVRCNTGDEPAGPGYDHAYLLVYTPKAVSVDS